MALQTPLLQLATPIQGSLSGTWGDTVNNAITEYTDIAIAGTLTLTGDGAVTLANTLGSASASLIVSSLAGAGTVTAQFAIVQVSGTTTTKVVTGPSYSKTYVVDNASSFPVTFKAAGQTGITVAAAEKCTVYFNGTDYVKVASSTVDGVSTFSAGTTGFTPSTATSGAVTLAGTLATTNGGTGLTAFTANRVFYASSTSAIGQSANLTFDGTTLVANNFTDSSLTSGRVTYAGTGGNLVDSANLTFDGTTLATSISGGVGFRATASSGTSSIRQQFVNTGGTLSIGLDASNGGIFGAAYAGVMWHDGNYPLVFGVNNTEQMRLTSTGLGIGTSSPSYKLDVAGIGRLTTAVNSNATSLILNNSNTAAGGCGVSIDGYSGNTSNKLAQIVFGGAGPTGGNIDFLTSANGSSYVQQMRLDTSGNLGLGVTPSAWGSGYKAIQLNSIGAIAHTNYVMSMSQNVVNTGGVDTAILAGYAAKYEQDANGNHIWKTKTTTTAAGNAISFTQALTLTSAGNLVAGATDSLFRLAAIVQGGANRDIFQAAISGVSNGLTVKFNNATSTVRVNIASIPTSSAGLSTGDLWNDGGTLKIA